MDTTNLFPINYTNKSIILIELLYQNGIHLINDNGTFYVDNNPILAQELIDGLSLATVKAKLSERLDYIAKFNRDALVQGVSFAEMSAWSIKLAEAADYLITNILPEDTLLFQEAKCRHVDPDVLIYKVMYKAEIFKMLEASIAGTCGYFQDKLHEATTFDEVNLLNITNDINFLQCVI